MDQHVFHHCIPFRTTIIRALMELMGRIMPTGRVELAEGGGLLTGDRGEMVQYVPDSLQGPGGKIGKQVVLITYTGLTVDRPPQYRPATTEQAAGVVQALGLPAQSWMSIAQRVSVWQARINMRRTEMCRVDVTFWRDTMLLPLVRQVILVIVTTALPVWRVRSFGQLALHLPRRSQSWVKPPPHVYVGQRVHAEEILALAKHRHKDEGVVVILEELGPRQSQPWMRGIDMYKFSIAESTLLVTPRLMAWLDHADLRSMRREWQ